MEMDDCKRGTIVTLIIPGSPLMVVLGKSSKNDDRVRVLWFDAKNRIQNDELGPDILVPAGPAKFLSALAAGR